MNNPPVTQFDKWRGLLLLAVLAAGVVLVAGRLVGAVSESFNPNHDYDTALAAVVTKVEMSRHQYYYLLEGSETGWTGFNQYVAADPARRQGMLDGLGYDPSDLGHYLHQGDSLTKAAHSPLLVVRRGLHRTRWLLYRYTPEARRPAQKPAGPGMGANTSAAE